MSKKEFSQSECSYIFLDESGKPEVYSTKGINLVEKGQATKYLVLVAVKTSDQLDIQRKVTDLRAELLRDEDIISFSLRLTHSIVSMPIMITQRSESASTNLSKLFG